MTSVGLIAFVFIFLSLLPQPQPATAASLVASTPTISLTAPTTATLTVTPNTSSPTTASSSISVTTNNTTGYNLSATTQDNTNDCLKSLADAAIDCSAAINKIINTTGTPTTLATNTWGVSLDNGTTWQGIPLLGQPALSIKTTTAPTANNGTTPDTSTITYGVKVDGSLPADTYSGTVIITAIANVVPAPTITSISPATGATTGGDTITITGTNFNSTYEVTVGGNNCNNANIISNTQITCTTPASTLTTGDKAGQVDVTVKNWGDVVTKTNGFSYIDMTPTISTISPTSGSVMGGTSIVVTGTNFTGATAVTVGGTNCTSFTVNSATKITCVTPAKTANTYAVAVTTPKGTATKTSAFTYTAPSTSTDFSATYCNSYMAIGDIVTITDPRNSQQYRVKKMQDSKCWMIDNLKIANITVNNTNTNLTGGLTSFTIPAATGNTQSSTTPYVFNPAGTTYCDTTVYTENPASKTGCGYLYNWPATTAGTSSSVSSGNATSSICPINFRLPTGNSTGEFAYLNAYMAGVTPPSTTNSYYANWMPTGSWQGVSSGAWNNGLNLQGSHGLYWSSSVLGSNFAYSVIVDNSSYATPGTSTRDRYYGYAVRCVAS